MNSIVIAALIVIGVVLVFSILVRLPPRRKTLDQQKPSKAFHGLVLFGEDGAYVEFDQKLTGDCITFTKKYRGDGDWVIRTTVSSSQASASYFDNVKSHLAALGNRFQVDVDTQDNSCATNFDFTGSGLHDHHALEGVARIFIRCLKHPKDFKYRVEFKGPKNYRAVHEHFETEKKKWKGEE